MLHYTFPNFICQAFQEVRKTDGKRTIFHSDLNAFYASVEILLDPSLQGKAVAVCGSTEDRHGIVLAKSEPAKKAGVKTGMVIHEAKRLCPDLISVPPHFDQYLEYSAKVRRVYEDFTDNVEPYGMDECWLQVPCHRSLSEGGFEIAEQIRSAVKEETGLTVSVGVSFNKVFAKLGSDMKKPDAVTVITREDYRDKIWWLPVSSLLYAGRATTKKLNYHGIWTIGDLAGTDPAFLQRLLGINGLDLWNYANGNDNSLVMHKDFISPVKSVSHGITCRSDLVNEEEVWLVMLHLCQDIGHRLRKYGLAATGVQITIKDNTLACVQHQKALPYSTQSPMDIAFKAREIFNERYKWANDVRAVSVGAIGLVPQQSPQQLDLFTDMRRVEKRERLDYAVEKIRDRWGERSIYPASLMFNTKLPAADSHKVLLPGMMLH